MKVSRQILFLFLLASLSVLQACSSSEAPRTQAIEPTHVTPAYGPEIDSRNPPEFVPVVKIDTAFPVTPLEAVSAEVGAEVAIVSVGGKPYFAVEGAFRERAFASLLIPVASRPLEERNAAVARELKKVHAELRKVGAIALSQYEEVGYFTFLLPYQPDMMAPLKNLESHGLRGLTLSPVAVDRESLKQIKSLTPRNEGLEPRGGAPRQDTALFSGIERMHATEFVRQAQADIGSGIKVNGDSVRLGITDTGITYNHRTFLSSDRKRNRIIYMRDFTREGRVYFNLSSSAEFKAETGATDDEVVISAGFIATPKLPAMPAGDQFNVVHDLRIKTSPELKAELLAAGTQARLGVLLESSMSSASEEVDLNGNGKIDDKILVFLVPGKTPAEDKLYVDISATGDFRGVKPLQDFNTTRSLMPAFAEKIGFDLRDDKLPSFDGKGEISVRSASIVGFDPNNHGSHVAGIAAGSRTIFNDAEDTLARGVAPDAAILMNRVCANNGGCNATQAMVDLAVNGGAQVINMSLGGLSPFNDGYGAQETIVNRLTQVKNVLMVISAGNSGPGTQTVGSPSVAHLSLSVGAAASVGMIQRQYQWPAAHPVRSAEEDSDFMFFFSSRGPTAAGGFKPNIAAPGTQLSSIQLNTAPGARGGLDVFWGTSMAAPAATGAYALLLDAIQKYNATHPERPLVSAAPVLRRILMESARPFDVNRFDPATGERLLGQYSWADQGTGMVDLVAAWKKVKEYSAAPVPTAVTLQGEPVELDYQVVTAIKNPQGQAYDGTIAGRGEAIFGTGLYLDASSPERLYQVHVLRQLPEQLAASADAGDLTAQLEDTMDEFVLKTRIYGSDKEWIRAGALDAADCDSLEKANAVILGSGAKIIPGENGKGSINAGVASTIHVCVDRRMIAQELAPGDHGALIAAYRKAPGQGGKVESVPSFWIPVSLRVPHERLVASTGYEVRSQVKSFGVSRNYVFIPKGTSLVRVTLEVPGLKKGANGLPLAGERCSGVELMAMQGNNMAGAFKSRLEARIANCDKQGAPVEEVAKRRVTFTAADPRPGMWDIHVFGQYKYADSSYTLRVDYVVAETSVKSIEGGLSALNGTVQWKLNESSIDLVPETSKSRFVLNGLVSSTQATVGKGESVIVESPLGQFRAYPAEAKSVTITTGGSPGNDIDLGIMECKVAGGAVNEESCQQVASSGGSSDEESASFAPKAGHVYAVRVDGFDVTDSGAFISTEEIRFADETGAVTISGGPKVFTVDYTFDESLRATSKLLSNPLFAPGKFGVTGRIELRAADDTVLYRLPVAISNQ